MRFEPASFGFVGHAGSIAVVAEPYLPLMAIRPGCGAMPKLRQPHLFAMNCPLLTVARSFLAFFCAGLATATHL